MGRDIAYFAVRLLGDMPTFTGYEPNNLVGKGPGNVPISMGALGTTQAHGRADSSSAPGQQIVPAETLDTDLSNLFDEEMSSLFGDMLDEPLVPLAGNTPMSASAATAAAECPTKVVAKTGRAYHTGTSIGAPKDDGHHGAPSSQQAKFPSKDAPKDGEHHGASSSKQARFPNSSGEPKDDEHHGKPKKQARFPNDDSHLCPTKVEAAKGIETTRESHLCPTKVVATNVNSSSSNDASIAADQRANLESEISTLRKALEAKDLELRETKIHAETYAHQALQDSRSKAEQALAFQKGVFETAHEEYSTFVRDICDSEVAQSTANLEAIANSVISGQQQELQTASIIVANLQQHLSRAQSEAAQESQDKLLVESRAKAAVNAQKISSSQQLSALRVSLEHDAQASHSKILKGREDEIKSEAEARHTAGMQQQQQIVNNLQSQLQQAALKHQELEVALVSSNQNCIDSEGNLVRLTAELRKTQESLVISEGHLSQTRSSKE